MEIRVSIFAIIPKSGQPSFSNSLVNNLISSGECANDIATAFACLTMNFKFSISSDVIADKIQIRIWEI